MMPVPGREAEPTAGARVAAATSSPTALDRIPLRLTVSIGVGTLLALAVLGVVRAVRVELAGIVIAVVLAVALDPVVTAMTRRLRSTRLVATAVLAGSVALGLLGVIVLLGPRAVRQAGNFGDELPSTIRETYTWPLIGQRLEDVDAVKVVTDFFDSLPADFDADRIAALIDRLIGTTGLVVLVLVTLFAVLNDGPTLVSRVRRLVPPEHRDRADEVGRIARRSVGRYFAGSLLLSLLSGLVILSAGLILRVPLAPLAGIWVAITNLIPQVGGFLGGSLFVVLAFSESPVIGVLALVVFLTWQNIENHILHPTIIGKAVNLSPPTTMIAALIGATAAGVPGAILATPLLGAAKSVWQDTVGRAAVDEPSTPADRLDPEP